MKHIASRLTPTKEEGGDRIMVMTYETPCGDLMLGSYGDRLCLCDWQVERHRMRVADRLRRMLHAEFESGLSPVVETAIRELDEYFAGERREFDVPLMWSGTGFQCRVWDALLSIPYGKTISYGEMARMLGRATAVRAVANANGANSISIFAPCHRVIGANGTLTGYGGGLDAKQWLLRLEGAI
ncbi:methylated-DNA--[protein]-cysteine S-methyltransferase [uncultured Muribaculum sp.]|uniref:methylated-DNA--[protein]-cysteine S-methyltransferase n=1 Tax=uncultured Muribaculum sp. TaxID=1918613 RepID=UPI0025E52526|nr:methylated-DNA--[protein]-cysteine S-methyltransferase [uncultured Muribaculum sp.]